MKEKEILMEKIQEADVVLVGIGEEFNERFELIGAYSDLMDCLEQVDKDESISWTVPFMERDYLDRQHADSRAQAYQNLFDVIKDKNYFIVSTCIDGNVRKYGFDENKIVEPCGSYVQLQCSDKCNSTLYDASPYVEDVVKKIKEKHWKDLNRPICPLCGKPLVFNQILSENYVEEGYLTQWEKYTKWLQLTLNKKLCVLELGVGMNLPNIIRWPFEKIAFFNQKASFFRINESLYQLSEDLGEKGVSIACNAIDFLNN